MDHPGILSMEQSQLMSHGHRVVQYIGSTVYVGTPANPDLTINTGGHLTINPGITVIFTQLTSDLFINRDRAVNALEDLAPLSHLQKIREKVTGVIFHFKT